MNSGKSPLWTNKKEGYLMEWLENSNDEWHRKAYSQGVFKILWEGFKKLIIVKSSNHKNHL